MTTNVDQKVRVKEDNPKWETPVTSKFRRARSKAYSKGASRKEKYKHLSNTVLRNVIDKNKKAKTNKPSKQTAK